ncbi:hypothetical protein [Streptosporangium jomthongense]|uniref:Uncharacterized protein n=1 Tax=Streptosporangium jomthongense TaxID=1193683 RepID=A0ABV8F5U3_9ACTN
MLRRHRFGVPALLVMGVYLVAVVVAAGAAWVTGDLGVLWWLTVFTEAGAGAAVTWPNVIVLVLAGALWAWALWQCLRGPLAGPSPTLDRDERRLRAALYASAATWLLYFAVPSWPWWVTVLDSLLMVVVVLLFRPVLTRGVKGADRTGAVGVLAYGGVAVSEVLALLGRDTPGQLNLICALATLVWTVLVLRAQWMDGRWRTATVRYGIASLLLPVLWPLAGLLVGGEAVRDALTVVDALGMVWLIRSAHDLADPRPSADSTPLPVAAEGSSPHR